MNRPGSTASARASPKLLRRPGAYDRTEFIYPICLLHYLSHLSAFEIFFLVLSLSPGLHRQQSVLDPGGRHST